MGLTEADGPSFVERAMREARNAGRLNHPGVVAVHDMIAPSGDDDAVYIVVEYVQAPTLAQVVDQQGPLPVGRVAAMGLGILNALAAAYTMGIGHRDVKPVNVLVREGDGVKLTDFGIALAAEDARLTRSGVIGAHSYLAPECFEIGQAGPAADLWALGATLFHAKAGRAPFERDTTTATLRAILLEDPPAPPCGPPLAEVITGLLTRPVDQRLTSDAARQGLHAAASEPVDTTPTADTPPAAGQGGWEAQATTVHRPPTAPPPSQPWGQTTPPAPAQPWGQRAHLEVQPSPYGTEHSTHATTHSPGPAHSTQWAVPPPRRNPTPWIAGGVLAAAAVLLLVVFVASSGKEDGDDPTAGERTSGQEASGTGTSGADAQNPCPVNQSDPFVVANYFVSSLSVDEAGACVYADSVPESDIEPLLGRTFFPRDEAQGPGGDDTGPFVFEEFEESSGTTLSDGATLTVTVTQESDGNYWVTDMSVTE